MHDDQQRLATALAQLGIRPGQVLLVHSSLRSLGPVEGGAATVIDALRTVVGPEGTLLLPALSYRTVTRAEPYYSHRSTPSCVGVLAETFRTLPGVVRSVHPTHSVCGIGARAVELTADHHRDRTPVGPHSPFRRLAEVGGSILMLGCGLRPNTFMHGVEEIAQAPYLLDPEPVQHVIEAADGTRHTALYRRHGFGTRVQRYDRVAEILAAPFLVEGPVLASTSYLIDAAELSRRGVARIEQDPYFFVD